jgi:Na+/H+-dicarboxylate symporter
MKSGRLTLFVFLGLCLGALVGLTGHALIADAATLAGIGSGLDLITALFLRAIKMLIAPLVLTTLLGGIARAAASGSLGRIALRALAWFLCASIAALFIGLAVVETLKPGVGMHLTASAAGASPLTSVAPPTFSGFVEHLLPTSILDAMARNEVLQIVMFSLVAGIALARMGEAGEELLHITEATSNLILKMASYVMMAAPIAVFSALASVLLRHGIGIVGTFASYVGEIYLALALLWVAIITAGALVLGPQGQWKLMRAIREPALLAFATTSSESAYPVLLAQLEAFGVPNRIASFVLPLGYSFNLVGSMCYGTFAALFLAQAYDVSLTAAQIAQLLLLLLLASKGIANVPRASLLVVAAILPYFHIPEAGVLLILAVDSFVDMGRTCTNTVATAIAAASVAKWEGMLRKPQAEMRRTAI